MRDCLGGFQSGYGVCDLFFKGNKRIAYKQCKTGKAHNDFSDMYPLTLNGRQLISPGTPPVVLINHNTYSMGNGLASIFKDLTHAALLGEKTGGGGGSVISTFLPNGWGLAYTFTRYYNLKYQLTEDGIEPHIKVTAPREFWEHQHRATGEDPQLEKALEIMCVMYDI